MSSAHYVFVADDESGTCCLSFVCKFCSPTFKRYNGDSGFFVVIFESLRQARSQIVSWSRRHLEKHTRRDCLKQALKIWD